MAKRENVFLKWFLWLVLINIVLVSCEDENSISDADKKILADAKLKQEESKLNILAKTEILDSMKLYYLWYNRMNEVSVTGEDDPETFFYKLLFRTIDKWSFILTTNEYDDFVNAVFYGHGIGIALDEYGGMRVSYVFNGTKAKAAGVKRGWKFITVNSTMPLSVNHLAELLGSGETQQSNSIQFETPENNFVTVNLTKEKISINPFLQSKVYDFDGKKTGYLALQSFMADSSIFKNEIRQSFENFNNQNITELIIDLRYNSGGNLDYTQLLADAIIGRFHKGRRFVSLVLNNQFNSDNEALRSNFSVNKNSLNNKLSRIFFITNNESASASEVLIACLRPYIDMKLIGSRTSGKPVGMFDMPMRESKYILVPIIFSWVNANSQSISYNGIPVDKFENDDLSHEIGDTSEACFAHAIKYIKTGSFGNSRKSYKEIPPINTTGYRAYRNVY